MASRHSQLRLALRERPRWGGRRKGAGRKPSGKTAGIRHTSRQRFAERHPAHVTLRVREGIPSLRLDDLVRAFERSLGQACERRDFRVVHYSLQSNHVHMLVESGSPTALANGMKSVAARLARAVNRVFRRTGPVLADRYHLHLLRTPREVRNALRYVLLNARHHTSRLRNSLGFDPASSGRWFDGWLHSPSCPYKDTEDRRVPAVAPPRTWLLSTGWRRHGLIDPADVPG